MAQRERWSYSRLALIAGTAVGVVLLFLVLQRVDSGAVWQALLRAEPRRMVVVLGATLVIQFARPWRWWLMFPAAERPAFRDCFGVLAIANMVNFLVPGRGGELLRWLLISHRPPAPRRATALATVGVEKLFDALAVLLIVNLGLYDSEAPAWLTAATVAVSTVLLIAFATVAVMRGQPAWLSGATERLTLLIPVDRLRAQVHGAVMALAAGLQAVTSRRSMLLLGATTALVWTGEAVGLGVLAWAIRTPLSLLDAFMVIGIVSLGTLLPAAPGFVGTWEFFAVTALGLAGVELQAAVALSLVMHGWAFVVAIARGVVAMAIERIDVAHLIAAVRRSEADE